MLHFRSMANVSTKRFHLNETLSNARWTLNFVTGGYHANQEAMRGWEDGSLGKVLSWRWSDPWGSLAHQPSLTANWQREHLRDTHLRMISGLDTHTLTNARTHTQGWVYEFYPFNVLGLQ